VRHERRDACNYTRDGRRSSEVALQGVTSNHSKLRWLNTRVVSVREKVSYKASGKDQGDEEIEPLLKCRKRIDEIKTEGSSLTQDKLSRNLLTG
jgi:hypothetical protein